MSLLSTVIPFPFQAFILLETEGIEHQSFIQYLLHSNVFNIVLVLLILGWVIRKFNLLSAIDRKQSLIAEEVKTIEQKKQEALTQLQTIQERTRHLDKEVAEILSSAKTSAEALAHQILEEAKLQASKIVETSKKRVALEQKATVKALEARLMVEAVTEARDILTQEMDSKGQRRSVESFLDELAAAETPTKN